MAPPPGCSSPALSPPSGCSRALHSSSQSRPFHVFAPTCSARAISPRPHFGRRTTTPVARIHLQARAQNQRPRAPLLSLGSRAGTPASHIHHQDLIRIETQKRSARSAQGMEASGTPAATPSEALPQAMPEPVAVPVTNKDGDRLAGLLLEPCSAGGASPAPLAILCHGFRSSKRSGTLEGVATGLQQQGVASYRFDFAGNGESEGTFDVGNYKAEVEDLRSVVLFWRAQGRDPVAIVGHSKGGNVVLLYASKYGDVACVVNLAGRCQMERGLKERYGEEGMKAIQDQGYLDVQDPWDGSYRVTREAIAERLATDMVAAASAIPSTCRVLTVHGSQDDTIPVEDAQTFSSLIQNHQLVIVEGGDHRFSKQHRPPMVDAVVPFILESVKQQ